MLKKYRKIICVFAVCFTMVVTSANGVSAITLSDSFYSNVKYIYCNKVNGGDVWKKKVSCGTKGYKKNITMFELI